MRIVRTDFFHETFLIADSSRYGKVFIPATNAIGGSRFIAENFHECDFYHIDRQFVPELEILEELFGQRGARWVSGRSLNFAVGMRVLLLG